MFTRARSTVQPAHLLTAGYGLGSTDKVLLKTGKSTGYLGCTARLSTMSIIPEKSSENADDDGPVLVQTLDSEDYRNNATRRASMLRLSRKVQLSAYFTIAAAAFGLIR